MTMMMMMEKKNKKKKIGFLTHAQKQKLHNVPTMRRNPVFLLRLSLLSILTIKTILSLSWMPLADAFSVVSSSSSSSSSSSLNRQTVTLQPFMSTKPRYCYHHHHHYRSIFSTGKSKIAPSASAITTTTTCAMTSQIHDDQNDDSDHNDPTDEHDDELPLQQQQQNPSVWKSWWSEIQKEYQRPRPPPVVQDFALLQYDIILLLNLTLSISFWVVHRMQWQYLATALNEGCLLCLCWATAGLGTGAFLWSAIDGHNGSGGGDARNDDNNNNNNNKGRPWFAGGSSDGPTAAAQLASLTFCNAVNLRLLIALGTAILQHRPVGGPYNDAELLLPLELGCGWILMPAWRWLHSTYTPRW